MLVVFLSARLQDKAAYVEYSSGGDVVVLEDSSGQVADWFDLYQKKWILLSGSALKSAEQKFAKDYAIGALSNWIVFAIEGLKGDSQ